MNFATFVQSELLQPFTEASIRNKYFSSLLISTGQTSDFIHHISNSQSPVFLLNSRPPLISYIYKDTHFSEVTGKFCRVPLVLLS